ncbi:tRNA (adenosine(37)-N6)-dimethylallyltransferase MiaA [Neolewinella antarctica]|uniref:tRNA dimethylallyltransferase n=1 Tax=Neolewinella antarctica TaxID=442734 RepID=A0ABX0X7C6_9BACT|nr:tRNA (adenosine(37)-N6)-dimethylallyltransferase MiaA [Neolewinella antarctica]NJC24950.1 tRNA dimethylallyltransferase [Neolewinella antarctica]
MPRTKLTVVGGPTASGKTTLAIKLAKQYGTEIISADSRQFYTEMKIGNARPTEEELAAVPHHFVADRSILDPLTAGSFAREALQLYHDRFTGAEHLIVVGGSGLYLRALCEGLDEFPDVTDAARSRVQCLWEEKGIAGWQQLLAELDPTTYATVDRANPRRLQRMLEVSLSEGQPYSSYLGKRPARPFDVAYLTTDLPRELLYDRINRRVAQMVAAGLEAEAQSLTVHQDLPALQTVGYREWWPYFRGEYNRARVIELIKQHSRRYAKRQGTWFRGANYMPVVTP